MPHRGNLEDETDLENGSSNSSHIKKDTDVGFLAKRLHVLRRIEEYLTLAGFAIAGTMAREGLIQLTTFELAGSIWANSAGCLIMGLQGSLFGPPLAAFVGIGFCGALTSFSTFMTNLFDYATSPQTTWPNYGWGVPFFLHRLFIEMSVSFSSYYLGKHLGTSLNGPIIPLEWDRAIVRLLGIFGLLSWIAVVVISATVSSQRSWPLTAVFAPIGVWTRYWLMPLNRTVFRLGTIISNMSATIAASILWLCMHLQHDTSTQLAVMAALASGFCGSLSTISSFIAELDMLRLKHAYIYGISTVAAGFSICIVVMGSYKWTSL